MYVCLAVCAVVVPGYIVYMLWRGVEAVREELRKPEPTPPPDAVERSLAALARDRCDPVPPEVKKRRGNG